MIPAKPKIRALEAFPLGNSDKYPIGLRDPTYQASNVLAVNAETFFLITLMNGKRDISAIQEEFVRRTKTLVTQENVERLIWTLEQNYFLDSPRFWEYRRYLEAEFLKSNVRPMFHAYFVGNSAEEISEFLQANYGEPAEPFPFPPRAVICPHIDYQRGKKAYNAVFPKLPALNADVPILLLGVAHFEERDHPYYATAKDFETPFGIVPTSKDSLEIVQKSASYSLIDGEFCHRFEHSIELVLLLLKWKFQESNFSILPILCGSFDRYLSSENRYLEEDEKIRSTLQGLRKLVKEKTPLIIACVDFSHIGPKFGWENPVSRSELRQLEHYERQLFAVIQKGSAEEFFSLIAEKKNHTNIDAFGAVYTLLSILPSTRFIPLHYEISYDEAMASAVSFASLVAF